MKIKFKKMRHCLLRNTLHKRGHNQSAIALAIMTGRSESYMSACLAGRRSFQPKEMEIIMNKLGIEKQNAMEYFPPFGIERPFNFIEAQ